MTYSHKSPFSIMITISLISFIILNLVLNLDISRTQHTIFNVAIFLILSIFLKEDSKNIEGIDKVESQGYIVIKKIHIYLIILGLILALVSSFL